MTRKPVKPGPRMLSFPPMRTLLAALSLLACAGCAMPARDYVNIEGGTYSPQSSYMTFEHPFTDAGAANVRKRAERHCGETRRVALMTRRTCSLTLCTVDYQCMTEEEAARVAPPEVKK